MPASIRLRSIAFALVFAVGVGIPAWTSPAAAATDDVVLAVVDNYEFKRSDVQRAFDSLPVEVQARGFEEIYPLILNSMIESRLVAEAARAQKLDQTSAYQSRLALYKDRLLEQLFFEEMAESTITDADIKARYDEVVKQLPLEEEVRARHILVSSEAEAKTIIKDLQGGADFVEQAKTKSTGPTGPDGGDLGFFREGQMVPAFNDAVFSMAPGEITTAPVKTQFGWHVIKLEEKRKVEPPALSTMEPQIRQSLIQEAEVAFAEDARSKASIQRFNLDGSPVKN